MFSTGGAPAPAPARPGGGAVAVGVAVNPAGAGNGEGRPAGNCEVKPAGLGNGEGKPDGLGKGEPGVPGAIAAGAAGCGTACTLPREFWAGLAQATAASKAAAQTRSRRFGEVATAFMLDPSAARLDEPSRAVQAIIAAGRQ